MASLVLNALSSPPMRLGEALSGIFGSISLTAWICLLLPQLIANYKAKSADALSMKFLLIWLLGDMTNLAGTLCTKLAPTAIALASYFCFADIVLISQCTYYNTLNARRRHAHAHGGQSQFLDGADTDTDTTAVEDDNDDDHADNHHDRRVAPAGRGNAGDEEQDNEQTPLLARRQSDTTGLPGSHRRHSLHHSESTLDPLRRIITGEDDAPDSNPWLHNTLSLAAVWLVGAVGWFISYKIGGGAGGWDNGQGDVGRGDSPSVALGPDGDDAVAAAGMMLGYASAVLYLCARIPQIIKNYREKSTEGLAILFFLLSLTGNLTYGASLVSYAESPADIVPAIPWLLGSLGTMVEDSIIFVQFRLYSTKRTVKTDDAA